MKKITKNSCLYFYARNRIKIDPSCTRELIEFVDAVSVKKISFYYYLIKNEDGVNKFAEQDLSRIIEMAWEDRTPFEAIHREFGLNETAVIRLMRENMKPSSFKMWRKRVTGRKTKHVQLRSPDVIRAYCSRQYKRF